MRRTEPRGLARRIALWTSILPTISGCYTGLEAEGDPGDRPDPTATEAEPETDSDPGETGDAEPLDPEVGGCDPATLTGSTLRRLNRREYRNTVQDLFGLASMPAVALPWDDLSARGFDNDGSSLALDDAGAEQYFDAAVAIAGGLEDAGTPPLGHCAALDGEGLSTCIDDGLQPWLERAFRRPVAASTVDALREFTDSADSYASARDAIVTFTLTSPLFLFHYKPPVDGDGTPDPYLLADRLAYLVWSSTPDDTLLDAARDGSLSSVERLESEVDRMLADPRSGRFFADFSNLWLKLGVIEQKPDAELHGALLADMERETRAFFEFVAEDNLPLRTLLDGSQSYLNGRLADHYGIDVALGDDEWDWVELPAGQRKGLLTQGALLVASSGDTFSDPIRRGAWVAEQIVCHEPPPPPFEPPELPTPEAGEDTTVRELLEQHREDPACASCHALMDPYGLALESYDRLGLHRTAYDNGRSIDASGVLPDGTEFDDAVGMAAAVAGGADFETCAATFLSAYSVGRSLDHDESCFVELVVDAARERHEAFGIRDLLVALAGSYMFVNGGDE